MPKVDVMMAQAVYDMLFSSYATTPPGMQGGSEEDQKFPILDWRGTVIDKSALQNAWSLKNPNGSQEAAKYYSELVDSIPSVSAIYEPNGNTVSQIYEQVLNAQVVPPAPDPVAEQRYKSAHDFLYTAVPNLDEDGLPVKPNNPEGKPTTIDEQSQVLKNYRSKEKAYGDAVQAFMAAYSQYDMSNPKDQRTWALLAPTLQRPLNDAWNDMQGAQAAKIENAFATLSQAADNQVAMAFMNAKRNFAGWRRGNPEDPNALFLPSFANPGNWYTDQASGWTSISFSSNKIVLNQSSSFTKYGGGGGFSLGFFSIGGGGGHSEQKAHLDSETSNLTVSFEFMRVDIRRPWLDFQLFGLKGWRSFGRDPGSYSNGTFTTNHGAFPLLPTSFIVARNVKISANWGKTDFDSAQSSTNAGGSLSFGPFSLCGSYQSGSKEKHFQSTFENGVINAPHLQIMGWVTRVVPYSPKSA